MTTQSSGRSSASGAPDPHRMAALTENAARQLEMGRTAAAEATDDLLAHGVAIVFAEDGKVLRQHGRDASPEYVRDLPPTAIAGLKTNA